MNIKDLIKYSYPVVYLRILSAKLQEVLPATRWLATAGLLKDTKKLATELHIRAHALEKGMSIGKGRIGFGKAKAKSLINRIDLYLHLGGSNNKACDWCGILDAYISYNDAKGANMLDIKGRFNSLLNKYHLIPNTKDAGIYLFKHEDILKQEKSSFDNFSQSRFSIRDFGSSPVSKEQLEEAFKLCERTPSACNRQSWRLHVYTERDKIDKMCKLQGGSKGFFDGFQGVILICSDITCYQFQEPNQYFVDGGIYAMNLLYALHSKDIASIPLTMGHKQGYLKKIKKEMSIPANEMPILLIGYGSYKDTWKVAKSKRYDWHCYVKWDS